MFSSKQIGPGEDALSGGYKKARQTCSLIFGSLLDDLDNAILTVYATPPGAFSGAPPPFRIVPRGRGMIVPEIRVRVNGQDRWYTVGVTLGDVLGEAELHPAMARIELQRRAAASLYRVEFLDGASMKAMPLLSGDTITWQY